MLLSGVHGFVPALAEGGQASDVNEDDGLDGRGARSEAHQKSDSDEGT